MKFATLLILVSIGLANSIDASAALRIHETVKKPEPVVATNNDYTPENINVFGRGREQKLSDAINMITNKKLSVKFVNDEISEMNVSWRSNGEPLQIMLTQLARNYSLDIVINEPSETLYIDVDTGQCSPHREASLRRTKRQWKSMSIEQMPTLPAYLPVEMDSYGYEKRLC